MRMNTDPVGEENTRWSRSDCRRGNDAERCFRDGARKRRLQCQNDNVDDGRFERESVTGRTLVLDTIGFVSVKQILADHRYDQILRCLDVERRSETTCQSVGDAVSQWPTYIRAGLRRRWRNIHLRRGARWMTGRRKKRSSSVAATGTRVRAPESCAEAKRRC